MIDYLAEAQRCRTENQFNRLHIMLGRILTPLDMAGIAALARRPDFPDGGRAWLDWTRERSPEVLDAPEPFGSQALSPSVRLYSGPAHPGRRKRLMIAFTGSAQRMMIPTAPFLQSIDCRAWDVLLLMRARSFFEGVDDVANDFDGLLRHIAGVIAAAPYAGVSTIGVSSGASAALIAAVRLKARRGVSICGTTTPETTSLQPRPRRLAPFLKPRTELIYVYGDGFDDDRAHATVMADAWGGQRRTVRNVNSHNVIGPLLRRGQLRRFLEDVL